MSDDKDKRGSPDRNRISLSEDYEVRDWSKSLGVTEQQLRSAIENAGNSAQKSARISCTVAAQPDVRTETREDVSEESVLLSVARQGTSARAHWVTSPVLSAI